MNKEHLLKILKSAIEMPINGDFFNRLYAPEYFVQPIDENHLNTYGKKLLSFDYKSFGFEFVQGSISCTGVELRFKSNRFEKIIVNVFYDPDRKKCANTILAIPKHTENDWVGRKTISQRGHIIRSPKSLKQYIEKLYCQFDCPLLN
jgi:hypothetical protein